MNKFRSGSGSLRPIITDSGGSGFRIGTLVLAQVSDEIYLNEILIFLVIVDVSVR